jgi:hypothetical protein
MANSSSVRLRSVALSTNWPPMRMFSAIDRPVNTPISDM